MNKKRIIRRTLIKYYLEVNKQGKRKYSTYRVNVRRIVRDMEEYYTLKKDA